MFTLFDLIQLAAVALGGVFGYSVAWPGYGLIGALAGGVLGIFVGRLPLLLALFLAGRSFRAQSTAELRARLRGHEHFIAHLLLAELLRRGEDVSGELQPVLELLRSDLPEHRRLGWACLHLAFPERAHRLVDFDPLGSTERCREQVAAVAWPPDASGDEPPSSGPRSEGEPPGGR